ncbi:D-glycero-beta-D-manno-heptose 1,7-bisphosphate 7-phosphatase [Candidatus Methylobacter oryzae]|uniref:D,D-heptose 1,7-bisphosphate phosphatase n=1 Tax=Candidatus Methylobacter oryzae TaxID=2497749 RepID=A0ABY3C8H1_9GAMM|nr:D-glycero-beta-D-manno-heptose 1,7-bisphosphate 7-phosphatase [Candidatus Methylobacter oryzae]TRW92891.1 D-glycero-beta-D-manno-heptose 1,7-bisphosphate 7-phosphatase [Candidatus Methylobacter oryzae]
MSQNRYVLLDRDGVINHDSDEFIKSPEQWLPIDGSLEAIALLNRHGYKVVVITNQSGLARGLFDADTLEKIHAKMQRMTEEKGGKIDAIYFCPHGPDDDCACRKPKPGLFKAFAADNNIKLDGMTAIGDSLRDLQAAKAAGANPILVKTGKGQKTLTENPNLDIPVFETLYDAAQYLTSRPQT